MSAAELVVTGIGSISPWGSDPAQLRLGPGYTPAAQEHWFDAATELKGRRGFKYAPPACGYLLAATRRAIEDAGDVLACVPETRRGMAVGTNVGIVGLLDAMDETVTSASADQLSPASAPYFSVNTIAGRVSMEYAIKGWNLTLTSPRSAGLEAIMTGARAVAAGRSTLLLAGAFEARVPRHHGGVDVSEAGASMLVLEPRSAAADRGAKSYGSCAVATFFVPDDTAVGGEALHLVKRVITDTSTPPLAASLIADDSPVSTAVAEQLRSFGLDVDITPAGAGALLPMLHVAHGLARGGDPHIVATASGDGTCALAVLRPEPAA